MLSAYDITLVIYNITLIPIIFFSVLFITLSIVNLYFVSPKKERPKRLTELPFVSIQVPTFNDPIAARCVERCLSLDYPKDRYEIIIVDDSTSIETQETLQQFADKHPGFVKYIHRTNREGFKPGALKNAMSITKGEILVIFDADWIPKRQFLREVVKPFADPKIAVVQTRQGFYNAHTNIISRFAAYLLQIYHTIIMPINNSINAVFFCGTAGAIRRSAFDKVGGWNLNSITEDSELTIKLLLAGYKTTYLEMETPSEVPDTFESFVKQQMRWCYGNTRVFFDNAGDILFKPGLTLSQRGMIMFVTIGNVSAPIVILMTLFGFSGWFLGEPQIMTLADIGAFMTKFLYTMGFLMMGIITFYKRDQLHELKHLVIGAFTVGLVLAVSNSYAFFKAVLNHRLHWFCTPKLDNQRVA